MGGNRQPDSRMYGQRRAAGETLYTDICVTAHTRRNIAGRQCQGVPRTGRGRSTSGSAMAGASVLNEFEQEGMAVRGNIVDQLAKIDEHWRLLTVEEPYVAIEDANSHPMALLKIDDHAEDIVGKDAEHVLFGGLHWVVQVETVDVVLHAKRLRQHGLTVPAIRELMVLPLLRALLHDPLTQEDDTCLGRRLP